MTRVRLGPIDAFDATLRVPGDKSIGHRALLLNALAEGRGTVTGLPSGRDVMATREALSALGVPLRELDGALEVESGGRWRAEGPIDCGNSGTTARLLLGALAPRATGVVTLTGDRSLRRRPMGRIVEPLLAMGARIEAERGAGAGGSPRHVPLTVTGASLTGRRHRLRVASAQVKSALLLAGLMAEGETVVEEPGPSRDHTERLLERMGARIGRAGRRTTLRPGPISAIDVDVPGDFSSAAPFLALAASRPGARVAVEDVGLNPTRTGLLEILRAMGAVVMVEETASEPEPRGCVEVHGGRLAGTAVQPALVPRLIDELPLVAVLGTQAEGETVVTGAAELRVKESDRIDAIVRGLRAMGATIEPTEDGFVVRGPARLRGTRLEAASDHRIGMALAVAAALADSESVIDGAEWVDVSYPGFFERLGAGLAVGT